MLAEIAYTPFLGFPLIMWGGIITLLLFLAAATIPILNRRMRAKIPLKWHIRLAYIALALAFIHGMLAISPYLGW